MAQRSAVIASKVGLHARPAATFVKAAQETGLKITIENEAGKSADATSTLGVMMLGAKCGETVTLSAEGEGAEEKLAELVELLEKDLDE